MSFCSVLLQKRIERKLQFFRLFKNVILELIGSFQFLYRPYFWRKPRFIGTGAIHPPDTHRSHVARERGRELRAIYQMRLRL